MSERPFKERNRLPYMSQNQAVGCRKLLRTLSSSYIAVDVNREKRFEGFLNLVALTAYSQTISKEAEVKANQCTEAGRTAVFTAHSLTEISLAITEYARSFANNINNQQNFHMTQIYALASDRPISLHAFLQIVAPENHDNIDKVSKAGASEATSYVTSSSDDADRFSWPSVRRIKSITEFHESHANMLAASESKRKKKMVGASISPSPLLSKEDSENIQLQMTSSPKVSQNSGIQCNRYSIRSGRSNSSSSFSSK